MTAHASPPESQNGELVPMPDFRYVGVASIPRGQGANALKAALGASAVGAGTLAGFGVKHVFLAASAAALTAMLIRRRRAEPDAELRTALALVPWGVLVDPDDTPRVLRWAAIKKVSVQTRHGRDQGTSTNRYSIVTVESERDSWSGRAPGAVPLDRLLAYLEDWAREQARPLALDLEGDRETSGPLEPDCESLLTAARDFLDSAAGASRLDLPPGGYRTLAARAPSDRAIELLGEALRDRSATGPDRRALAAVLAAEIHADALADDLVTLVQCPHPVIAGVARQAARKLGVSTQKAGALEEVAPFLFPEDAESLAAWVS